MVNLGFDISGIGGVGNVLRAKLWHLQRTFSWQLMMTSNFDGILGYLVSQYCQDVQFGDYSISEISTMKHGAFQRFYAGIQSIDTITLTFLVPTDNSVMDYFYGWYNKMIDTNGYYHPKNNYRRDIYLILYDQTGIQSNKYRFRGVFPISHPKIHPTYAEDDVLRMSITLRVDMIEPTSLVSFIRRGALNVLKAVPGVGSILDRFNI